jgi:hypothetical protein
VIGKTAVVREGSGDFVLGLGNPHVSPIPLRVTGAEREAPSASTAQKAGYNQKIGHEQGTFNQIDYGFMRQA